MSARPGSETKRSGLLVLAGALLVGLAVEVAVLGAFGSENSTLVFLPRTTYLAVLAGMVLLVLLFVSYAAQTLRTLAARDHQMRTLALREAVAQGRLDEITALLDATRMLAQKLDLQSVLHLAVDRALHCFEADHASVLLLDPRVGLLEVLTSAERSLGGTGTPEIQLGRGIVGTSYAVRRVMVLRDPGDLEALATELGLGTTPQSALCVPICFEGNALGVFCVARGPVGEGFGDTHAHALQVLADHCGAAIFKGVQDRRTRTERERAQAELRRSEERYRRFFQHNVAGTYVSTPDGRILDCNPAFARMLGFAAVEEVIENAAASPYAELGARQAFLALLRTQRSLDRREASYHRADGSPLQVIETAVGVFDPQGELVEIHGYVIDDSERHKAQEHLRLTQRMEAVGKLAGGIAHDFNNMLTAILGGAEQVRRRVPADHPAQRSADGILKAAARAATLTRQLLAYSRQQVLQPRLLDLSEVLSEFQEMLRQVVGENIEIVTALESKVGRIKADPGQLQQVILNLAANARDAMPDGGKLTVRTEDLEVDEAFVAARAWVFRPGRYVLLTVHDTGCGMDAETQRRAFEPFFTTKDAGKGAGLGLATVYGIVKQSGGHIELESQPGRGTSVRIYLPRVDEAHGRADGTADAAIEGSETVLLAEDEDLVRGAIREMLESGGYTVLEARSAGEAVVLSTTHEGAIDLLVTDLVMPGRSGQELVARMAKLRPDMAVLCISGYADPEVVNLGSLESGTAFLQKPFTPEVLLRKIREVLDAPRRMAA